MECGGGEERREEFGRRMMNGGMHKNLAYIDECGFSIWIARSQGRSVRGLPAVTAEASGT